jgi:translocation and assembly module TamA
MRAHAVTQRIMGASLILLLVGSQALARQQIEIEGRLGDELSARLQNLVTEAHSADSNAARVTSSPAAVRQLTASLRSEGYYGASVTPTLRDGQALYIIRTGDRFTVGEFRVNTEPAQSAATDLATSSAELSRGDPLQAEAILAAEARSLSALQEAGWPEAELNERQVLVDHEVSQGEVSFNIATGTFSRYGEVVLDDDRWRSSLVSRLDTTQRGDVIALSELRQFQNRLAGLESVARARIVLGEPDPGTDERALQLALTPAPRHVLEAGIHLSTGDGGGIDGRWIRRNAFGGDETLNVTAQLATLERSVTSRLTVPHFRRLDQTLALSARLTNDETDAFNQQEAALEASLDRQLSPAWSGAVILGLDVSRLDQNGAERDTQSASAAIAATFDNRDSTTDPKSGSRLTARVTPVLTQGDIESGYVIAEASLRSYQKLGDHAVLAGRVRAGDILGASLNGVPADQRFYAGGGGSVRGFEYQALSPRSGTGSLIGGRSVIEASAELRWRVRDRWGVVAFADTGLAFDDTAPDLSDLRTGVGVGVRYHFDFAPLRLDIAAPVDRRSDEASLHVYIGLGQAF